MKDYIVIADRKKKDGTSVRVFWIQRDDNRMPEFSEWEAGIIKFSEDDAKECVAFLSYDVTIDGVRICEPCLTGSQFVSNIKIAHEFILERVSNIND